jgi:6-phosphogluconolactonase (cycloisomerase 2 family)
VLQNNAGDNLTVSTVGSFAFSTPLTNGATYQVTVLTQPQNQRCTVSGGSGTITSADVVNVQVICITPTYSVGGTVAGLVGTVVLQNNAGDNLTVSANGSFSFATPVAQGEAYQVTLLTQPAFQRCTVTANSGTIAWADVTNVEVACEMRAGKYVYVLYAGYTGAPGSGISQYTIGADGGLVANGTASTGADPRSITVDPSGKYAYVTNIYNEYTGSGEVWQYKINANGTLSPMSPATISAGNYPYDIVVDPSGKFVYVTASGGILQYTIDATGGLVPQSPATVAVTGSPHSIAIDPSSRYAYVTTGLGVVSQYTIGSDGVLTPMMPAQVDAASSPNSIEVDPTGRYVYLTVNLLHHVRQYTVGADGALSPMVPAFVYPASNFLYSLAVHPSAKYVYIGLVGSVSQHTIGADGTLSPMTPASVSTGTLASILSIAADYSGKYVYATILSGEPGYVAQYTVNSDGTLTAMTPATVTTGSMPKSIAISP